ncbi:MAG: hypothetical protein WA049_05355 [Ferribacterium limneticum]
MDSILVSRIRDFVSSDQQPTIEQFLACDAPTYELTLALSSEFVSHSITIHIDPATKACRIESDGGVPLLQITKDDSGKYIITGILAKDISEIIGAVRIHEVESFSLINLPPEMRKADLEYLCNTLGVTTERLQRLTNIWIAAKNNGPK